MSTTTNKVKIGLLYIPRLAPALRKRGCLFLALSVCSSGYAQEIRFDLRFPEQRPAYHAYDITTADLDYDGTEDIIIANGNDVAPGPLTITLTVNDTSIGTEKRVDWISEDIHHGVAVQSGDLNGDGLLDIVLASSRSHLGFEGGGGIYVYWGTDKCRGEFCRTGIKLATRGERIDIFSPSDIVLGDIDADGDVDLVASTRGKGLSARIFLNKSGWLAPAILIPGTDANRIALDDLNDDGLLDLALNGKVLQIFLAAPVESDQSPYTSPPLVAEHPMYRSQFGSYGLATLTLANKEKAVIASNSESLNIYKVKNDSIKIFRSKNLNSGTFFLVGTLATSDINEDGVSDLLISRLNRSLTTDCPSVYKKTCLGYDRIQYVFGQNKSDPFGKIQLLDIWSANKADNPVPNTFIQGISVSDFQWESYRQKRCIQLTPMTGQRVFVLPDDQVAEILSVKVTKSGTPVPFTTTPHTNWLSLVKPIAKNQNLTITYELNSGYQIVLATGSPQIQNFILEKHERHKKEPKC